MSAHDLPGHDAGTSPVGSGFPPVTELTVGSLGLVIVGAILMASSFLSRPSLVVPAIFLAASAALTAGAVLLMLRHPGFAWGTFVGVARWALVAYVTIAAMIGFSFIHNGASGAQLLVLTLMLLVFAVDVPLSIGFTVARFHDSSPS